MQNYQYYWGKIQVENRLPEADQHPEWVFSFSDTWSVLEVYLLAKEDHLEQQLSGAFTPYSQKEFVPTTRGNLVKVILPPGEVVTIYFRDINKRHLYGVLITRTWTATDKCGNTNAVSQEILVVNNDIDATFSFGSPVIECNSDNNRLVVTPPVVLRRTRTSGS